MMRSTDTFGVCRQRPSQATRLVHVAAGTQKHNSFVTKSRIGGISVRARAMFLRPTPNRLANSIDNEVPDVMPSGGVFLTGIPQPNDEPDQTRHSAPSLDSPESLAGAAAASSPPSAASSGFGCFFCGSGLRGSSSLGGHLLADVLDSLRRRLIGLEALIEEFANCHHQSDGVEFSSSAATFSALATAAPTTSRSRTSWADRDDQVNMLEVSTDGVLLDLARSYVEGISADVNFEDDLRLLEREHQLVAGR